MGVFDKIMLARTGAGYLESLIFNNKQVIAVMPAKKSNKTVTSVTDKITGTKAENVTADVTFSYNYKTSVKLTENPVDNGVIINDHRIIMPEVITIDVGINNIVGISDILKNRDVGTLIQAGKLFLFGNRADAKSRVAATFNKLKIAQYNGDVFELWTPLGKFKDMLITDIESLQDENSISVFRGRITYKTVIKFDVAQGKITNMSGINALAQNGIKAPETIQPSLVPSGVKF